MKSLSERLAELSADVGKLEESAAAAAEKNRRKLEIRRMALIEKMDVMAGDMEAAKPEAELSVRRWWDEARDSLHAALTIDTRADFEVRAGDLRRDHVQPTAAEAEKTAEAAVDLAAYYLNVAEWAVVDAALARADAEDAAEAP